MPNTEELKLLCEIANNQSSVFSLVGKLYFPRGLETFTLGNLQKSGRLFGGEFNSSLSYKMDTKNVLDSKKKVKRVQRKKIWHFMTI